MSLRISWERRLNAVALDERVAVLESDTSRLEIWPALGFTAYRWVVAGAELLYAAPSFFADKRPTRSGIPVLFPFPNRIRDGRFTWAGRTYRWPLNDPAKRNAIHGCACHAPWRILDEGADDDSAWLTGEFQASRDAPALHEQWPEWPADGRLRLTYRLRRHSLRLEAVVDNPDTQPLPFGLGYHPYFALAPFGNDETRVTVPAAQAWPLADNLPTGTPRPVESRNDLRTGPAVAGLHLDDVLTELQPVRREDDLRLIGQLQGPGRSLDLWATDAFRELVAFTPPHREAICLEPYTCATDAINLHGQGIDAGLRVLAPGEHWRGEVVLIAKGEATTENAPRIE